MKPLYRLLAAVVVLAAVVIVLFWPKKAAAPAPAAAPLVKVDVGNVKSLDINQAGQPAVQVVRAGSDWKLQQPYAVAADDATVVGLLGTLGNITDVQDVGAVTDLASFGLDKPSTVDVGLNDGQTLSFQFGADTPTGGSTYLRVGANGPVKIVPNYVKENAVKTAFMLQDKKILTFPADQLTGLVATGQGKKVTLARTKSEWPKEQQQNVQSLLDALGDGQMTAMADATGKDGAKDGLNHPTATLQVTWPNNGTALLTIGDKKGAAEYYARSSASPAVFTISDYLVTDINAVANPTPPPAAGTEPPK